jgi:RNA polymerase sigma factor (TIGR02999 family)
MWTASLAPKRETTAAELLPLVYEELRRLAAAKMAREPSGDTFQATTLVHEAWLRLNGNGSPRFENRTHFFGAAAEAMRRILIERARQRLAAKRGGGIEPLDIHEVEIASPAKDDTALLALDEALEKFAAIDPRKAELVKLRYYVGLNFEETAAALGIAVPTAKQWWGKRRQNEPGTGALEAKVEIIQRSYLPQRRRWRAQVEHQNARDRPT